MMLYLFYIQIASNLSVQ